MTKSLALTFILVLGGALPARSLAARDPLALAKKCRATIARSAGLLGGAGLKSLDACHRRRDAGRFQGDCNSLASSGAFGAATSRAGALIAAACPSDSPVRSNYGGGDPKNALVTAFLDAIEESGRDVQGDPVIAADRTDRTARAKCHGAIGTARSAIVRDIVRRATACQNRLDRRATAFLGLDPSCAVGPGAPAGRARGSLGRACRGLDGLEIGSCVPLPDCVIAAAAATGAVLAQTTYGSTPSTVTTTTTSTSTTSTSVTTTTSTSTTSTSTTVTTSTSTTSTSTTTTTIAAVCGNNIVELGETCDDGNAVDESDSQVPIIPTDNCPKTCAIELCSPGAQTAQTVAVNFALPSGSPQLFGITVFVNYPDAKADLPGSGSGVTGSISNVNPGALNQPNDLDYGLLDGLVSLSGLSGSKLFNLTLQRCPGLSPLAAGDFTCLVKDASDQAGSTVAGVTCTVVP